MFSFDLVTAHPLEFVCNGSHLSPILLMSLMDRILGTAKGRRGSCLVASECHLFFAHDAVCLLSDLQLSLEQFAPECEVAGMTVSTPQSESMILSQKRVKWPLWVRVL